MMSHGGLQVFLKMRPKSSPAAAPPGSVVASQIQIFPGPAQTFLGGQGPGICILTCSWVSVAPTKCPSLVVISSPCPGSGPAPEHTGVPGEELCPVCAQPMLAAAWQVPYCKAYVGSLAWMGTAVLGCQDKITQRTDSPFFSFEVEIV